MRIDASLDALLADALTSDYEGTDKKQYQHRSKRNSIQILIVAASATLVTIVLGMAIAQTRSQASENSATRDALVERVQAADRRVQALEASVVTAQNDLISAESATLAGTSLGEQAQQRLERLRIATGQTQVSGSGITVTIDDAPSDSDITTGNESGKVLDGDLQLVINGLWQSGATHIAINERRLTPTSAIRSAGRAILVNYRPLIPPYVVTAISPDANKMAGMFRESSAGLLLEELEASYGVFWELNTVGEVTLPAAASDANEDTP
jgi:uncharacterized protein YlxW (UPF0749 family)